VKPTTERTEALMQSMGFTLEELTLNSEGRLSARQRKLLGHHWAAATTLAELLDTTFIRIPLWWMVALLRRALRKEVHSVEGAVKINDNGYSLTVGNRTFYYSQVVMASFEDGTYYRLYFEAHPTIYMPRLLSGEAVDQDTNRITSPYA
jgi:hypothetical protein